MASSDMHCLNGLDSFTNVLKMDVKSPFSSLYDFIRFSGSGEA